MSIEWGNPWSILNRDPTRVHRPQPAQNPPPETRSHLNPEQGSTRPNPDTPKTPARRPSMRQPPPQGFLAISSDARSRRNRSASTLRPRERRARARRGGPQRPRRDRRRGARMCRVVLIDAWPSLSWMTFGCFPWAMKSAACVWRRSWNVHGSPTDALTAGSQIRRRKFVRLMGPPAGAPKIRSVSSA